MWQPLPVERTSLRAGVAPDEVQRLSRRTITPTTVEPHGSQQSSRLFERITSACAAVLRGIVSPCRWREFVEPTVAKRVVETAQVNIKRTFHGYLGGLHNASCELICGKLKASVTNPHIVVLTAARAAPKARRVSPSRDPISAGHQLPIGIVVYAFHPIFPDTRAAHIELPVSNFKRRTDNPRTDPDVRKSRIKKSCLS